MFVRSSRHQRRSPASGSREVIVLAVRWYLRYGLSSYRDVEELLAERGVQVNLVQNLRRGH